jgi:NADPH:quinone reductase-like Zn-dependent oxidoreductase/NAD(P)-dependent dehydrogenase (short-subunit alcohol dehydrogenase family)
VRAGPGASLSVGDAVVLLWPGALATHATLPAAACFRAPAGLDAAEAAGLPTVFQTALHALERCAELRAGERVLIHAAAGGVGQAALQVARRAGAEIYATASPSKHAFLRAQGVRHVFSSRTLAFSGEVLAATGGEGVDVVLNSLAGEHVDASLACLKRGGRFVEIGKLGVKTPEAMRAARPDVAYFLFDLSEIMAEAPELLASLQADLVRGFAEGTLAALPTKRFPARRAVDAFRYLAQAKNVGKVVLVLPAASAAGAAVRGDRTYLVTGGLGALGLAIAERLVADGARQLVLCGRRSLAESGVAAQQAVAELEAAGAAVRTVALDVARRAGVESLLASLARELPPLAGVVHCAGVLADGMVLQLLPESIAPVLAPKVDGARHLDELTRGLPLDFFVLFSSMAAPLGAEGQAVYGAANAVMDALAERRAAEGLPALSIQWGPWAGGGMAGSRASRNQVRFAEMGLRSIAPEDGAALFARLLSEELPTVAVLPIAWSKFLRRFARGGPPPFYAGFAAAATAPAADGRRALRAELSRLPAEERAAHLAAFLERELLRVLGFPASTRIDPRKGFSDLGVDSLLAVDLRNRLEAALEASLPATLLFDHPNLEALVAQLAATVLADLGPPSATPAAKEAAPAADEDLSALEADELARRLAEEIDALSSRQV